ncbi:MAG: GNAT family N-acetyltransferase [Flavobacteriales bacterium]|mgnify:FL=1|jgi:ribosomal-protein-alanine N-acetyltransferase|tara:strand:- start:18494 stop:18997 length:504 start_codon:yes stop_codon:yes gene_type:complete
MTVVFETERLNLRHLQENDGDDFYKLMSNQNVVIYTPSAVLNRKESDLKLASLMNTNHHFWAVELKTTKEFIGIAGLKIQSTAIAEIAYSIREQFWSKGYGGEIAKGLIKYGFTHFNYSKLLAFADPKNKNSLKILSKQMNYLGCFYSEEYKCDDETFELTKKQWTQ